MIKPFKHQAPVLALLCGSYVGVSCDLLAWQDNKALTDSALQRVHISVRDHGLGIPHAFCARSFSQFSQADATETRQECGTGLGLAICKELI